MKKRLAILCAVILCLSMLLAACDSISVSVTVKFDVNYSGGVNPKEQKVVQGEIVELPAVSRDGYDFDGWYTAATGGQFVGFDGHSYTAAENVILYAHWTEHGGNVIPDEPDDPDDPTPVESKTIVFYSAMSMKQRRILEEIIESFEDKYPDWEVKLTSFVSYDEINEQILTDLQVNKQPDIALCYADNVANYLMTGKVVDLGKYINSTETVDGQLVGYTAVEQSDFITAFWNEGLASCTYGDYYLYGYDDSAMFTLPFTKSTEVMYYNKTVLDELGLQPATTWDELWQQCETIKLQYPRCIPLGYDSESYWFINMCQQNGWGYTSPKGEHFLFDNENTEAWLNQLKEYYNLRYFTTGNLSGTYTSNLFNLGVDGGCVYSIYASSAASFYSYNSFEVGVTQIPASVNGSNYSIAQGASAVMFENNGYSNAYEREVMTFLFMKELLEPQVQASLSLTSNYIPVRSSVYDLDIYQEFLKGTEVTQQAARAALSTINNLFTVPVFRNSTAARIQVGNALVYAVKGEKTAAKALNDAYLYCVNN